MESPESRDKKATGPIAGRLESALRGVEPVRLRRAVIGLALLAFSLTLIGAWANQGVQSSLEKGIDDDLNTILEANVTALRLWADTVQREVSHWADSPLVVEPATKLLRLAREQSRKRLLSSEALRAFRAALAPVGKDERIIGFALVDAKGVLAGTRTDVLLGARMSARGLNELVRVLDGDTLLSKPLRERDVLEDAPDPQRKPYILVAAPVRIEGEVKAALYFAIDPDQDFSRILSVGRIGKTGETYAFNREGLMLSDSRFEKQLRKLKVLGPGEESVLHLRLVDPDVDLTRGLKAPRNVEDRRLTKMAQSATQGESGTDVKGYRDYRGVTVVGAWRWLDDLDFGIATEVDRKEAFAALEPVKLVFLVLFALVGVSALGLVGLALFAQRMRRRARTYERLGQYTLGRQLGAGGMGEVYLAEHAMLRRPTAIKLIRPRDISESAILRFEQEVQHTSQLTHPNTVAIYDYGRTPEGVFYYAMEYLPGVTLARLIRLEGRVSPARTVYILKQVCGSLVEAHGLNLVHRDIKPLNIMLCHRGGAADVVKVLDFGLVKDIADPNAVTLTAPNLVSGTAGYVAPERILHPNVVDPRCDLYSLGCVAFNLLTGQDIFTGTASEIAHRTTNEAPPAPSSRIDEPIPKALDDLVLRCIEREPELRVQSAQELLDTLYNLPEVRRWTQEEALGWWRMFENEAQ
ncbi:MAG: serine/threonine protein kinase [Planctomycetota bacterium]